jgi:hypothetical protein
MSSAGSNRRELGRVAGSLDSGLRTLAFPAGAMRQSRSVVPRLGAMYVYSVPLLAGIATMRGDGFSIGGLNYTGFLWLSALLVGTALVLLEKSRAISKRSYFPVLLWLPWLCFLWASFAWSASRGGDQIRDALMQTMPILVGIAASLFVRTRSQLQQLVRMYYFTVPFLWMSVFVWWAFQLNEGENYVEVRGLSLTAAVIGGLALAGIEHTRRGWWIWAACLGIIIVTHSRIATVVMLLLPIINPTTHGLRRRLTAVGCVAIVGLGLLATPAFQERFFAGENKGVSDIVSGDFDSAGRFDAWPIILDEAQKRPLLGHGVGTTQELVTQIWPDMTHPHNDYLRLGYEVGGVGMAVFLTVFLAQFVGLAVRVRRTTGVVRQAFVAAWLGLAAFLVAACTDNPITYSLLFMDPIFALMGAAYAVSHSERADALRRAVPRKQPS